ncbi:hypothetical protein CUMW_110140, partial [Citrus unshiu]
MINEHNYGSRMNVICTVTEFSFKRTLMRQKAEAIQSWRQVLVLSQNFLNYILTLFSYVPFYQLE